ncbi:MAG: hypothetical protein ACRC67_40900 [Inquilinus sp.]|uniref:hypothetical protein n=1 Tax=Inquilinus sp. TaxID=1932117 RepID=UPI003F2C6D70
MDQDDVIQPKVRHRRTGGEGSHAIPSASASCREIARLSYSGGREPDCPRRGAVRKRRQVPQGCTRRPRTVHQSSDHEAGRHDDERQCLADPPLDALKPPLAVPPRGDRLKMAPQLIGPFVRIAAKRSHDVIVVSV